MGILLDGPVKREFLPLNQIIKEVQDLSRGEFEIEFPENKIKHGNWQVKEINNQLLMLLADPTLDLIIANGLISGNQASQISNLSKPVIAPIVADRVLQALPYKETGVSGKHNYVYISDNRTVGDDLRNFHNLAQFNHLGIVVDKLFLDSLPQLARVTDRVQDDLKFEITLIPVVNNLDETVEQLASNVDAIYVPPLLRFSEAEFKQFTQGLITKKLPSYSLTGRNELELGILATSSGRDIDTLRYARRIALLTQSILIGTDPANLAVALNQSEKLAINMRTAKAIGFSPKWEFLEIADLLYRDDIQGIGNEYDLVSALQRAIDANLSLNIDRFDLKIAEDDVINTRSSLLPQLSLGASSNKIDKDTARFSGTENSTDSSVNLSQTLYSESQRSGYQVAKYLREAADENLRSSILNTISVTSTTYLQLLSAIASEKVRRSNLSVTETNLELAESRLKIGTSDRAEVLRWKSQIATDRRNLYSAESTREQAQTILKQQLHLPLTETMRVTDKGITNQLVILESERFSRFFDNPKNFNTFVEFKVQRALENAPEIKSAEHIVASNERRLKEAKRAYYVPDVSLNARYGQNLDRSGVGSENIRLEDEDWSVGVEATLPLFTSGARKSSVSRANNELMQSRIDKENIYEQIESRILTALQQAKGSYPGIRLTKDAATAAKENLDLVIDSYSKGVVSITDLIDAQDASLAANLDAVDAQYQFMIDWIEVQRAVANFDLILTAIQSIIN
ncbi:MAG: TolC family protein [Pseudomonadota bacterium]